MAQPFNQVIQNISPLLGAMSASYGAGMGPFGYMPQGLAAMMEQQKADAAERQAAAASAAFDGIVPSGGGMAGPMAGPRPAAASPAKSVANDTMAALGGLPASLIGTESGGNWQAQNSAMGAGGKAGHFGRGQFGQARLEDAKRAGVIPANMTPQEFLANPNAQMAVERWHVQDIYGNIERAGLDRYIGQNIGGTTITREGMLAAAHLGGFGGLKKFLESGGQYNPADTNGTSLASYMGTHANGGNVTMSAQNGQETVQPAGADPELARLYAVRAVPGLSEGQAHVIDLMIEQRQKAIGSSEPVKGIEVDGRIVNPINGEVIYNSPQGQPEFRRATPEEAAAYGAQGGQFGPDGRFYPVDVPQGMTIESDGAGGFRMVQGPAGSANLTVDAAKNTGFLIRMKESAKVLDELESEGTSFWASMKAKVPGGNYLQTPEYQKYDQAKRDFVNAVLRRESGAVIADSEFANADRQYFPQPGDSDAVIAQKRANRAAALSGVEVGAGAGATLDAGSGSPEGQGQAGSTTSPLPDVVLTPDLQSIYDKYK